MKIVVELAGATEYADRYLAGAEMVIEGPTFQECMQHWANMAAKFANEGMMLPALDEDGEPIEDEFEWIPGHQIKGARITKSLIETPNGSGGLIMPNSKVAKA